MQEGIDGCAISQTYLKLIACFRYIENLDAAALESDDSTGGGRPPVVEVDDEDASRRTSEADAINFSIRSGSGCSPHLSNSIMGFGQFLKSSQLSQSRQ